MFSSADGPWWWNRAEMPTATDPLGAVTLTGKVTVVAPAGRNTVAGTAAVRGSLLDTGMVCPPTGALVVAVSVAVTTPEPAMVAGATVSVWMSKAGGGVGITVRLTDLVTPPADAV